MPLPGAPVRAERVDSTAFAVSNKRASQISAVPAGTVCRQLSSGPMDRPTAAAGSISPSRNATQMNNSPASMPTAPKITTVGASPATTFMRGAARKRRMSSGTVTASCIAPIKIVRIR